LAALRGVTKCDGNVFTLRTDGVGAGFGGAAAGFAAWAGACAPSATTQVTAVHSAAARRARRRPVRTEPCRVDRPRAPFTIITSPGDSGRCRTRTVLA
jgi:hypothetical protein